MPSGMSTCISNPVSGSSFTRWSATPCPTGPLRCPVTAAVGLTAPVRCPADEARKPPRRASRSAKNSASRSSMSIACSETPIVSLTPVKSGGGKKWLSPSILRVFVC